MEQEEFERLFEATRTAMAKARLERGDDPDIVDDLAYDLIDLYKKYKRKGLSDNELTWIFEEFSFGCIWVFHEIDKVRKFHQMIGGRCADAVNQIDEVKANNK